MWRRQLADREPAKYYSACLVAADKYQACCLINQYHNVAALSPRCNIAIINKYQYQLIISAFQRFNVMASAAWRHQQPRNGRNNIRRNVI